MMLFLVLMVLVLGLIAHLRALKNMRDDLRGIQGQLDSVVGVLSSQHRAGTAQTDTLPADTVIDVHFPTQPVSGDQTSDPAPIIEQSEPPAIPDEKFLASQPILVEPQDYLRTNTFLPWEQGAPQDTQVPQVDDGLSPPSNQSQEPLLEENVDKPVIADQNPATDSGFPDLKPQDEPPAQPPPRYVTDALAALRKMWNWIVVGEEHRRSDISMEFAIASTWLLRVGIITLIACGAYFLRWSIDNGILGPSGRVAIAVLAGLGLVGAGLKNLSTKYRLLGQGFMGGGFALLYFATYALGPLYHLASLPLAFALMSLVTLCSGVLAVRTGSQLIALLGIVGGYTTPILLRSDQPQLLILYSYLLLLTIGVLGIAHAKMWRLLNYLAFLFTWALFIGSFASYDKTKDFFVATGFLTVVFVLHSALVYYHNLIRRKQATLLEIGHLLFNAALYAFYSYGLVKSMYGRPWPAVMTIGLAVFYLVHVLFFLKHRLQDRSLLIALLGVAALFTALSVPLVFQKESLTIGWALLALTLIWMGNRLRSTLLIHLSTFLFFIVILRLAVFDMPRNFAVLEWSTTNPSDYWAGFWQRLWTFGIAALSLFGAAALHKNPGRPSPTLALDTANDIPLTVKRGALSEGIFWCGSLFVFIVAHLELYSMFSYANAVRIPVLTALWAALAFLVLMRKGRVVGGVGFSLGVILALVTILKLFVHDFAFWDFGTQPFIYRSGWLESGMRLLDYLIVFSLLYYLKSLTRGVINPIAYDRLFGVSAIALVFIWSSLETATQCHWFAPNAKPAALSILWGLFAISFLLWGLFKQNKKFRYSGLLLFAIVVFKVFLIDLAGLETLYRVIAFMIVGALLILGAFGYIKTDKMFLHKEDQQ